MPSEAQFRDAGAAVCDWLGTSVEKAEADAAIATRVFGLYLPIFYWSVAARGAVLGEGWLREFPRRAFWVSCSARYSSVRRFIEQTAALNARKSCK